MTARPVVSDAAERLYDNLRPYHAGDDEAGWPLLRKCEATARILARPNEALRHDDIGSGARRMLAPYRAPAWALPWLAQFAGIPALPLGLTEAQQRDYIANAPGMRRGRPAAMIAAAQRYLTGNKTVEFLERSDPTNPGADAPYHLTVYTYAAETPDGAQVLAALLEQKPAGIVMHYDVLPGWTIGEMEAAYAGRTIGDLEADFGSVGDLERNVP